MDYDVKDLSLAETGAARLEWDTRQMPVLQSIRTRFEREQPFNGLRVAVCLHVTTKTANLVLTVKAGGADVTVCASNPLSTQDDVAACLVARHGIPTFAIKGEDEETYARHLRTVLDGQPALLMDDGADLVTTVHSAYPALIDTLIGGTEETTTGVIRLRSMERTGVLRFPVVAVNESDTKHLFDNRYGTGQSALDGIIRATNVLLAGSTVVVCGYGWCGRGLAASAAGLGANVTVTEVNPIRALEAAMDGYRVMRMIDAAAAGRLFITVTGNRRVIDGTHLDAMPDGAILANAGHFNVEIDLEALRARTVGVRRIRPFVDEYCLADGRRLYVLGEGRLVNLVAGEGHPAGVMDLSFANQALAAEYLVRHRGTLAPRIHTLPPEIDHGIARLKLDTMGIRLDTLTPEQETYLTSWQQGT
ncbi:MAG: adenosylhomocysteinase [Candidatus Latescibacteria bacterium]|nr:adenosylhomocysteinase [Candidatus Latescibacterota bacterium]